MQSEHCFSAQAHTPIGFDFTTFPFSMCFPPPLLLRAGPNGSPRLAGRLALPCSLPLNCASCPSLGAEMHARRGDCKATMNRSLQLRSWNVLLALLVASLAIRNYTRIRGTLWPGHRNLCNGVVPRRLGTAAAGKACQGRYSAWCQQQTRGWAPILHENHNIKGTQGNNKLCGSSSFSGHQLGTRGLAGG